MKQLFAERLKSARMLNGFSLQDLENKINKKVTRQSLHKFEKGELIPDSEMLSYLCEALNVKADYFTRDTKIEFGELEFRKLKKLPVKEQQKIIEKSKDILSRYIELEEIIGIPTNFDNPLKGWSVIHSFDDVEKAALEVRSIWQLGNDPISNGIELLEDNHIKVITIESDNSFDGMQTWVNNTIPVIVLNRSNLKSDDRLRFTLFHELGHTLMNLEGLQDNTKEKYCHQFAASMLFPEAAAKKELGEKRNKLYIQELGEIKKQYGISIQAIMYRAKDLGIVTESYLRQFMYIMGHNQWKVNEPVQYIGSESSNRFNQLLFRALAEDLISMNKAAVLNNQSLLEFRKQIMIVE
jgi:Zn-dependent peptidase ImmA (M78 family)/transcriptional regulator with XRE-family HTH domain